MAEGRRGEGRIFKPVRRGRDGVPVELPVWNIAYWGPTSRGRREIRESARTTDREKAYKLLKERLRSVANHHDGKETFVGPKQYRVTVGESLDDAERDLETRGKLGSLRTARAHAEHVRDYFGFGHDRAALVTTVRIRKYIQERQEAGAAPATIDKEIERLSRAFNLAVDAELLARKPKFPKKLLTAGTNARQGFIDRAQFEAIKANLLDPDVADFAEWLFSTGMRKGEALSLTWEAFDRETWILRLPGIDAKTRKPRSFALEGVFRTIIERRLAARQFDVPRIFHRVAFAPRRGEKQDGQWGAMGDFSKLWIAAVEKAGTPHIRLHDFRRSAARNLIRAGVPQSVAMQITGHRTVSMFGRYNIIDEKDLRDAAIRVSAYLSTLPTTSETATVHRIGPKA